MDRYDEMDTYALLGLVKLDSLTDQEQIHLMTTDIGGQRAAALEILRRS